MLVWTDLMSNLGYPHSSPLWYGPSWPLSFPTPQFILWAAEHFTFTEGPIGCLDIQFSTTTSQEHTLSLFSIVVFDFSPLSHSSICLALAVASTNSDKTIFLKVTNIPHTAERKGRISVLSLTSPPPPPAAQERIDFFTPSWKISFFNWWLWYLISWFPRTCLYSYFLIIQF